MKNYIDLVKLRINDKIKLSVSFPQDFQEVSIPPLLFIPFIENAFKHTHNKKIENAITVNIFIGDASIQLVCENKYDSKATVQQTDIGGLGNELILKRLHLIYADKHTLQVHKTDELYSINLTIPNG